MQTIFFNRKIKNHETNCTYEEKEIIVKGSFPPLSEEDDYKFTGKLVSHPTYGAQFDVHMFTKEMPATETGLIQLFIGRSISWNWREDCETIVDKLGKDAIKKMLDDLSVLDGVPRLTDERKPHLFQY